MVLDPNVEFEETPTEPEVVTPEVPAAPPAATKDDVAALKAELDAKVRELDGLKSRAAIVDKLQEAFGGKVANEDPRDKYVRQELQRILGPEFEDLKDVRQIKTLLPAILETLQLATEERIAEKASTAQDVMRDQMKSIGLDPKDDEAVAYMEEALTREIKANQELLALWARGNVKSAVTKAFSKVQSKLIAPARIAAKRSAVNTITESPKAAPRGGAPSPGPSAKPAVDVTDTSRDGIRKIHDAAFERLQELLDRE